MGNPVVLIHLVKSTGEPEFWLSDDSQRGLVKCDVMGTGFKSDLEDALSRFTEFAADTGTATGGSNTTCVDTGKSWEVNRWQGAILEVHTAADSLAHYSTIVSNTATTITMGALAGAVSVASGDDYAIRLAEHTVGHDIDAIADGRIVVAAAGTALAIAASTAAKVVIITAELDNTDTVVIGGATCVAALATRRGTPLNPGDSVTLLIDNLNDVYIDAIVTGEGASFTYLN